MYAGVYKSTRQVCDAVSAGPKKLVLESCLRFLLSLCVCVSVYSEVRPDTRWTCSRTEKEEEEDEEEEEVEGR